MNTQNAGNLADFAAIRRANLHFDGKRLVLS
jgi:hypothetical protein